MEAPSNTSEYNMVCSARLGLFDIRNIWKDKEKREAGRERDRAG